MERFYEPLNESEVGVRDAREKFSELLAKVETGNHVIHITRHGERVSALVSPDVAESIVAIKGVNGPAIPGDMVAAIKLVESLLINDASSNGPNIDSLNTKRHELVGGCMSLLDVLMQGPDLQFGELRITDDDGSFEIGFVADLLIRKLHSRPDTAHFSKSAIPLFAGAAWAAQTGSSAVDYRLRIPIEVTAEESYLWLIALCEICQLINDIHRDRRAEKALYEAEEFFRSELSKRLDPPKE